MKLFKRISVMKFQPGRTAGSSLAGRFACLFTSCLLLLTPTDVPGSSRNLNEPERSGLDIACSSPIAQEVRDLWRKKVRAIIAEQISVRLLAEGDVYVLYDIQIDLASLLTMAHACGDTELVSEIATALLPAFSVLEVTDGYPDAGRGWLCKSASACSGTGVYGRESQGVTLQFMGLLVELAFALHEPGTVIPVVKYEGRAHRLDHFILALAIETVNRWVDRRGYGAFLAAKLHRVPRDTRDGSQRYLFTSHDLWMLTLTTTIDGLMGTAEAASFISARGVGLSAGSRRVQRDLWRLFRQRVSITNSKQGLHAELDPGYWQYFPDMAFSGYTGREPPVRCLALHDPASRVKRYVRQVQVKPFQTTGTEGLGPDISHLRRLVQVLRALNLHRDSVSEANRSIAKALPAGDLTAAFSNAIVQSVWNQSTDHPLFSNFWNGTNGWYRAGYGPDGEVSSCIEGFPPYGLTSSIATGGYFEWARFNTKLAVIANRLLLLTSSQKPEDSDFVESHYPTLKPNPTAYWGYLNRLAFLASLVVGGVR